MAKVFIGVGHGGNDPGAVGYVVEKDANLKMARACREYLENAGVQVLMSREKDVDEGLNEKISECNSYKPDYALDIHNNAGKGDGFEVYHSIIGGKGKTLALNIEEEVKKIGQNSRGLKTKTNAEGSDYFGFIRGTNCPAIICEGAFVDNEADAEQIDTDAGCREFGYAYARGILKTLGVEDRNSLGTVVVEQLEPATIYRVQTGAFKDKKNAEALVKELKEKGYEAIIAKK